MKRIIWTSALALTAMACLTACGDDDSVSAGGGDELYSCDISAKKVVVKQNAGEYSITTTYTHNEDGTMTMRSEYGPGHRDVCSGPMPNAYGDEGSEMTCKDNVFTVKTIDPVTAEEFQEFTGPATKVCEDPALNGKGTKPSDDDDETDTGADDDEGGSVGDDGGSTDIDDEDGDEGGNSSDNTCNFKKSDDTWVIQNAEGGGEMTIKWNTGKAVAITKSEQVDEEVCQMTLEFLATDPTAEYSCDGKFLVIEDHSFEDYSKDQIYRNYCGS